MEQRKKGIIITLCILVLLIAGFFVYRFVKNKQTVTVTKPDTTSSVDAVKEKEFYDALKSTATTDQDLDGVSDSDENKYKTNPTDADTDGDGLNDWQEVFIYKTDPLKNDTDADTFLDGYEVRRGFNPKGAGTL